MNIFDKRPLSLILCVVILAFVIFSFIDSYLLKLLLFFTALLMLFFVFAIRKGTRLLRVILIISLLSFVFSFMYFEVYFKAYNRYSGEVCIEGTVAMMENDGGTTEIQLSADNVDNTAFSSYNFIVYLDRSLHYGFSIGSKVRLCGIIESAAVSGDFNFESYYYSRGISGFINYPEYFEITDIGDDYPIEYKIYDYRQTISRKIISNSRNADVGGLMCALLLGDRDYLPTGTNLDFSRIGITHILALSGSHLVILSIGFMRLLMRIGVKKKHAISAMIAFTLFYMTVTGLSASVVRASLMLIISSSMFLLSRSKDSTTSLFLSVAIIILITPYSIYDVALWLSAFATLGIVVMCEYYEKRDEKIGPLRYIFISFAASFFAIGATLAITTFTFDSTSLLAALATFIFTLLTEAFIYLGIILLFFGAFLPVRYLVIPLGNLIILLADWFASYESLYLSTRFTAVYIIALLFSVLFFGFIILKIKHKRAFLFLLLSLFISYYMTATALTHKTENTDSVIYTKHSTEQITVTSDGEIMLIDIGNYNIKTPNSTYGAIAYSNLTHIDKYVITNYSYKLREMFRRMSDRILIDEIYIPVPKSTDEEKIYFDILAFTKKHGYKLNHYQPGDTVYIGNAKAEILVNYALGKSEKLLISVLSCGKLFTYANVGVLSGSQKNMANEVLGGSHAIVFGCHESKCRELDFNKQYDFAKICVFSSKKLLLSLDMLDYYSNKESYFKGARFPLYVE